MARPPSTAPPTNHLLDQLPAKARARMIAACEEVDLVLEDVIDEAGDDIGHVYFPTDSFISMLVPMGGKSILEVALAGNEGMYGLPVAFGVATTPMRALVQGAGPALRMSAAAFRRELARNPALRICVSRYIYVVMSQLAQIAGCNRFHVVQQRLARWLLMTADRAHSTTFRITHEYLAYMLGVRRVGITEAASALQKEKLITYTRGILTILDRKGLERASCSCYRSDLTTYGRIFH
ncbi:MAG: Crp/Fnr family transcriptional regulator [Pseudomonadota bacterium]|nr:Crp/Fnr family transcriptional regulator [Pseudomonadota bacterium]